MKLLVLSLFIGLLLLLSLADNAQGVTLDGWEVGIWGSTNYSQSNGVITIGDNQSAGPSLYREFSPPQDFEISLQVKAATLGEVNVDPMGAGEGFAFYVMKSMSGPVPIGIHFEFRGRGGGQFLLTRPTVAYDFDWTPFVYNTLGYNNGSYYWHPTPTYNRTNAIIWPDVWYTMKLKIQEQPFTATAQVFLENGTLLGTYFASDITKSKFSFDDINYVGFSSAFGGEFSVKNFNYRIISPIAGFTYLPAEPAPGESVLFNASTSKPFGQIVDYYWTFGDNSVAHSTQAEISHTYLTQGNYNVTLTVTDVNGTKASSFQLIRVRLYTRISISADSSSTLGTPIDIHGNLTSYNGKGIANALVLLKYSFSGAANWQSISSTYTDATGTYSAQWLNTVTGTFILKAEWQGNSTHPSTYSEITLNSLPHQNNIVFCVESNSTVTSLAFNSNTLELSFAVSGPSETTGYVKVTIAKSLLLNAQNLKINLDGNQLKYTISETLDAWLLTFNYSHSTHNIVIYLSPIPSTDNLGGEQDGNAGSTNSGSGSLTESAKPSTDVLEATMPPQPSAQQNSSSYFPSAPTNPTLTTKTALPAPTSKPQPTSNWIAICIVIVAIIGIVLPSVVGGKALRKRKLHQ